MLKKFSVCNYKKFKDEISIDFTQVRDYKFNDYCLSNGIISKSIMYGVNASGKSSFGYALFDIVMVLTDKNVSPEMKYVCKNLDSNNPKIDFKYSFLFDDIDVEYNYSKNINNALIYEELFVSNTKVFSYDFQSKNMDSSGLSNIGNDTLNFEFYEGNIAILRYIANNTQQNDYSIIKKIVEYVSGMLWFRSLRDNSFVGLENGSHDYIQWIIDNNRIHDFEKFLKQIANIDLRFKPLNLVGQSILLEEHKEGAIPFTDIASSGTISLALLYYWSQSIDRITFLFIDEFDAFYHFALSRKVVEYFLNYKNVQIMFTTHNTFIMKNDLLRPDCYFLLENDKIRSLADLTSRELREAHNLEKMFRQGEFNE